MRKGYKNKKRSCPLCKPQKTNSSIRWNKKDLFLLKEFERQKRAIQEILTDPDFGLEIRESFVKRMKKSIQAQKDGKLIPFEQIKKKYC